MTTLNVYYGTAHAGDDAGVYSQSLNLENGQLGDVSLMANGPAMGFQAVKADGSILYSICLNEEGKGAVRAYRVDKTTGALILINEEVAAGGKPCYVGLDKEEKTLLAVSYSDAVITLFPIDSEGGIKPFTHSKQHTAGTGVVVDRQGEAHTHSIYTDPSNAYVFICDLGGDKIFAYPFDSEKSTLSENPIIVEAAPGAGPRHLAFHGNGQWLYVINELNSTVTHYIWDAEVGHLEEKGTVSTLPDEFSFKDNLTAEIVISPDGRFLYGSNRGHDSVAVFAINEESGALKRIQIESIRGSHPRNINLDPTGAYLLSANRDSDNVTFFKVDKVSGEIAYTGNEVTVPKGICVRFLAS